MNQSQIVERITFDRYETALRQAIKESAYPFLGIHGDILTPNILELIRKALGPRPTIDGYIQQLGKYPALFSVYLARQVAEGTGQTGSIDVYPVIIKGLGVTQFPEAKRDDLWRAFRSACKTLEIDVSPRISGIGYRRNEYLLQAGIPLAFLKQVAVRMSKLAGQIGLPLSDDPEESRQWQIILNGRLNAPFPQTARRALELDRTCFYLRTFARLFESQSPKTIWEKAICEGIKLDIPKKNQIRTAQLILSEDQIGVLLPPSTGSGWEIITNLTHTTFPASAEEKFIPFRLDPAISSVSVKNIELGFTRDFSLWPSTKDNCFLLFSNALGRFVTGGSLTDKALQIEPGTFLLLSRFEPDGMEDCGELVCRNPNIFLFRINLLPGKFFRLSRGPASIDIMADDIASFEWQGISSSSNEGYEIYATKSLQLKISLPKQEDDSLLNRMEVLLTSVILGESIVLSIDTTLPEVTFDIGEVIQQADWKPGVGRLVAELRRSGSERITLRSSILIWNGLDAINQRTDFICNALPVNLNQQISDNLSICKRGLTFSSNEKRHFSFVFQQENTRLLTLTWNTPGIFLEIEDLTDDGIIFNRFIKLGCTISVTNGNQRQLRIFASENANIHIGNFNKYVNFSKHGKHSIPLASLLEYVAPGKDILNYRADENLIDQPLIRIAQPHYVEWFSRKCENGNFELIIGSTERIELLSIHLFELTRGTDHQVIRLGK